MKKRYAIWTVAGLLLAAVLFSTQAQFIFFGALFIIIGLTLSLAWPLTVVAVAWIIGRAIKGRRNENVSAMAQRILEGKNGQ